MLRFPLVLRLVVLLFMVPRARWPLLLLPFCAAHVLWSPKIHEGSQIQTLGSL